MTVLRPEDEDLHDEHGEHIEPKDRSEKGRLARHLARHRLVAPPEELRSAGNELAEARRLTREAQQHEAAVREHAVKVAEKHIEAGVSRTLVARALKVNPRTLRDYLRKGKAEHRNK